MSDPRFDRYLAEWKHWRYEYLSQLVARLLCAGHKETTVSTKTIKPDCLDCENAICDECDPNRPYAAVVCMGHGDPIPACGKVDLTRAEYDEQMRYPDRGWRCPKCKADAWFDDERFEKLHGVGQ